ncbi:F-box only protein 8 [Acorus gramineus]|uniref:F-box only protein 8 n=1 Tax=Acorus gramineus TaxID=55184 RepID=A0AAV9BPA4_ACOGR|nr:F-box only protein 8 [Acorus gramineus]
MDRVPEDILLDILSRLSFVSVLKCRLVSKSWRAVTSDLTFIGLHFARSRRRDPTLLLDVGTEFYMTEPKEDDDPVNPYDSFALRIPGEEQSVIPYRRLKDAACKGFLPNNTPCNPYTRLRSPDPTQPYRTSVGLPCMGFLLEIRSLYDFGAKLHMRIRNPWTGQVFVLPTYVKRLRRLRGRIDGFGFDPDIGEYKVLIIEYGRDEPVLHGSICTISRRGAVGSWRMIEMLVPFDMQAGSEQGTFLNGEIHWLVWRRYCSKTYI